VLLEAPKYDFFYPNVGNDIPVSVNYDLGGADADNYTLTLPTLIANITPKMLTISGWMAEDKTYDATIAASLEGESLTEGKIETDDVSLVGAPVAVFARPDAAENVPVTVSGVQLSGSKAANYTLILPILSAKISQAKITITPTADQGKARLQEDPELIYTSEGWKSDHTADLLVGSLTREEGESIGAYAILQGTLAVDNPNYAIDFVEGVPFHIQPGVGVDAIDGSAVKVYPSPVRAGVPFTVATAAAGTKIQVFALSGILIGQQTAVGKKTELTIDQPGVYIVTVGIDRVKIVVR
jgi:hypothetical protein